MKQYKPAYLGAVLPLDDIDKQNEFIQNKFDLFDKVYDVCKDQSKNINSVTSVDTINNDNSFSLLIKANTETIQEICKKANETEGVTMIDNVITCTK